MARTAAVNGPAIIIQDIFHQELIRVRCILWHWKHPVHRKTSSSTGDGDTNFLTAFIPHLVTYCFRLVLHLWLRLPQWIALAFSFRKISPRAFPHQVRFMTLEAHWSSENFVVDRRCGSKFPDRFHSSSCDLHCSRLLLYLWLGLRQWHPHSGYFSRKVSPCQVRFMTLEVPWSTANFVVDRRWESKFPDSSHSSTCDLYWFRLIHFPRKGDLWFRSLNRNLHGRYSQNENELSKSLMYINTWV